MKYLIIFFKSEKLGELVEQNNDIEPSPEPNADLPAFEKGRFNDDQVEKIIGKWKWCFFCGLAVISGCYIQNLKMTSKW